ncbi:hypothetical protein [Microbulbifer sp. Q7]|uniref:hypothetical protein n=1 Tax=Microbulbifer sp. Q7 TaxID=1785091 RepID=UPI00129001E9|nr:hypothetical protein [Microbulbifer sp. Q7]
MNRDPETPFPPGVLQSLRGVHHASLYATKFYDSRFMQRLEYPLNHCFQNLKKLHGSVKNILAEVVFTATAESRSRQNLPDEAFDIALRYQSLALLSPSPGLDLIQYLVATEHRQKRLQAGALDTLNNAPLKIALSAQTALLQVTIDRLTALSSRDRPAQHRARR